MSVFSTMFPVRPVAVVRVFVAVLALGFVGASSSGCDDEGSREGDTPLPDTAVGTDAAFDTSIDQDAPTADATADGVDVPDVADDDGASDGEGDVGVQPPPLEARPVSGRWFAGDLHVHATGASNDAGVESTPARIREVALSRGLDFVVLTDHSNSTGSDPATLDEDPELFNQGPEFPYWDEAAALSDASFLMIDGNELSPRAVEDAGLTGHVGCYPRDLSTFDPAVAFVDRPRGTVTGAQTLAQAREAGCFTTVNHPYAPTPWIAYDWTSFEYDALEVFNGGGAWDPFDHQAVRAWACDLAQGRSVTAVGGSDVHRVNEELPGRPLDPPLGSPTTWIFAESLEWSQLVASLDAGRVSVSDTGVPLDFDVYDASGRWLAMPGDTFAASSGAWVRVRGEVANNASETRRLQVLGVPPGGCTDTREPWLQNVPDPGWQVLATRRLQRGAFEEVFAIEAQPGWAYFAWLHPTSDSALVVRGVSLANAVWAE